MVFRLLTIGLCTACVILLATFRPVRVQVVRPAASAAAAREHAPQVSVVDVAAGVGSSSIPRLVRLARGEWIKAVNDQAPVDDAEAELMIGSLARRGGYLDLTVAGAGAERRVLMLIH